MHNRELYSKVGLRVVPEFPGDKSPLDQLDSVHGIGDELFSQISYNAFAS